MEAVRRSVTIRTAVTRVHVETVTSCLWMEEHVKVRFDPELTVRQYDDTHHNF